MISAFFLCILPAYTYPNIVGGYVCVCVHRRGKLVFKGNVGLGKNQYIYLKQMSELMDKPK